MNLHGIFPALTTPFAPDGSVAIERLRENIARYNRTRLAGYVANGSTGESVLLRWEEIYRVWEAVKESAAPGKTLIAGTAAESTSETIEHTNRAAALGYDVALVRTPHYYKPQMTPDAEYEFYRRVADAARIPIMLYSVPVYTSFTLETSVVARAGKHPNVIGMKDSSGIVERAAETIAAVPRDFQLLVGSATTLYESLEKGAVGGILALACVFPEICVGIQEAFEAKDFSLSQSLQQRLGVAAKLLGPQYGIPGIKYALDRAGYYGGAPRHPLLPVSEIAQREIDKMLAEVLAQPTARTA